MIVFVKHLTTTIALLFCIYGYSQPRVKNYISRKCVIGILNSDKNTIEKSLVYITIDNDNKEITLNYVKEKTFMVLKYTEVAFVGSVVSYMLKKNKWEIATATIQKEKNKEVNLVFAYNNSDVFWFFGPLELDK